MTIFQISDFGTCKVRKLRKDEKVKSFNCGDDDLNDFLLNKAGCRFITVDAYHDAIPFYKNNDFQYLRKDEYDIVTRLLYFDLNDIVEEIA